MSLSEFLLARIAEDEAAATEAMDWESRASVTPAKSAAHYARHDPVCVLAECEAKRRIVALYLGAVDARTKMTDPIKQLLGDTIVETLADTLPALALPYADHPDYRDEWRP